MSWPSYYNYRGHEIDMKQSDEAIYSEITKSRPIQPLEFIRKSSDAPENADQGYHVEFLINLFKDEHSNKHSRRKEITDETNENTKDIVITEVLDEIDIVREVTEKLAGGDLKNIYETFRSSTLLGSTSRDDPWMLEPVINGYLTFVLRRLQGITTMIKESKEKYDENDYVNAIDEYQEMLSMLAITINASLFYGASIREKTQIEMKEELFYSRTRESFLIRYIESLKKNPIPIANNPVPGAKNNVPHSDEAIRSLYNRQDEVTEELLKEREKNKGSFSRKEAELIMEQRNILNAIVFEFTNEVPKMDSFRFFSNDGFQGNLHFTILIL